MARKKIIAGNWKMNMTPSEAVKLVEELKPLVVNDEVDVVFCVPAIDIIPAMEAAKGTNLFFAIYETEEIDKDTKKVIRKRSYSTIPLNVVIERQKQGLSSAPEDENGNLPKYILSPNDLVYVPTQEEINKGEVVMPIDRDRIYKMVDSSGITANFIPASTANLIFALPKATAEIYCNGENCIQNEYGIGSPQSKNQKAITGEMVKEICFPIKVDRLGNIIQVGSCILTN